MIAYLKHEQIDTEKWDACINKSLNGLIYAQSWYLDLVNDRWEALVKNDYECVMPLTPGKKWGTDYLFQPNFTQQLGVFSTKHLTGELVSEFLDAIPKKYRFIEINLNTHNKTKDLTGDSGNFIPWKTHHLDLIHTYDRIAAGYSSNLKRNLKKAHRSPLNIVENVKPEDIIKIFRQNKGRQINNLKDQDYDLLRRLIYVMIYKRAAKIVGAYNETNELCAGAFFIHSGDKVIFYFSATDPYALQTGAMPLIIDDFIRKHAGRHLTLDFEGSNDENLARFYKGFGSRQVDYLHYRHNKLNALLRMALSLKKGIFNA